MESSKFKMSVHSCALFSTYLALFQPVKLRGLTSHVSLVNVSKIASQKLKKNLFRNRLLIVAEMDCTTQLLFLTRMVSSLLLGFVMNCERICGIFNMVKNCQTESFFLRLLWSSFLPPITTRVHTPVRYFCLQSILFKQYQPRSSMFMNCPWNYGLRYRNLLGHRNL